MPLPLHAQLIQMGTAGWITNILYAAAELGLADHLETPKTATEIASGLDADPRSLYRVMRTLASLGILSQGPDDRFSLTPLGASLKSDAPGSARSTLRTFGGPAFARGFENIVYSVKTGKTGFEKAHGKTIFDYLADHPAEASMFSETMVGFHGGEPVAVAAAYDFSVFDTIVDVGGATGNMLAAILTRHTKPRGVLFDRSQVIGEAPVLLKFSGVMERVEIEGGDFFEVCALRWRRLHPLAHSSRLERGAVPHDSPKRSSGYKAERAPSCRRDCAPARRQPPSRKDPRYRNVGNSGWSGTHRSGVRAAVCQGRVSPPSRCPDGFAREHSRCCAGLSS